MTFRYTDRHREEYATTGLTVLSGLIPPTLLTDLRRESDRARELARHLHGTQTQRLQPVWDFPELDQRPFRDFHALPGLRAAVDGILGPDRPPSEIMAILLEPATDPWCTGWHRDWLDAGVEPAERPDMLSDLTRFNQYNAALYDDHSLWVVPNSHTRETTSAEAAVPTAAPTFAAATPAAERERTCLEYARSMPGAEPLILFAGDVVFYRNTTWHIGNYVPYVKRATLHDGFFGPGDRAWLDRFRFLENLREHNVAARAKAQSANGTAKPAVGPRQRLLYLHAATPGIRSRVLGMALHEPDDSPAPEIGTNVAWPYDTVHDAIKDGWQVVQFPIQQLPVDPRQLDILGYEFILQKLEVVAHDSSTAN